MTAARPPPTRTPPREIVAAGENTRIVAENFKGAFASTAVSGKWSESASPIVMGPTAVQTALDSYAGRANLASGNWTLRRLGSGAWAVQTSTPGISAVSVAHSSAPSIVQVSTGSGVPSGGTLSNGTAYTYRIAVRDALGNFSAASSEASGTAGSAGTARVLVSTNNSPAVLYVWRRTGASFDRYCVIPIRTPRAYLYDTGGYLAGRPWITTGIPTVPSANATVDAIVVGSTTK